MLGARLGCNREPFRISPDSSSLYTSSQQSSVYQTLLESVEARRGLLVLLGEAGLGKTGIMLRLYDELRGKGVRVAFLRNGAESFRDVAGSCARQMDISLPVADDIPVTVAFTNYLIGAGELVVILIDEAHGLSGKLLRQLGHLANLEGDHGALVQIVLSGYPSLVERLRGAGVDATPALYLELEPLSPDEIGSFIQHYLRVAECDREDLFPPEAVQRIVQYSRGVPRQINALCRNAVVISDLRSEPVITPAIIDEAARDLDLADEPGRSAIAEAFRPAAPPPGPPSGPPAVAADAEVADNAAEGQPESATVPDRDDEQIRPSLRRTVWRAMVIAAGLFGVGLLGWGGVVFYHQYGAGKNGVGEARVPPVASTAPVVAVPAVSDAPEAAEPAQAMVPAETAAENAPVLQAVSIETREDEPAVLPITVGGDAALEDLEVRIAGLPKAARLSSGRRIPGGWAVDAVELEGLTVTMPEHRSGQFPLKVSLLDAITGDIIQSADIDLRVEPVPDRPQLTVSAADGDQYTAIPIQIFGWLVDHDGSEKLRFYIEGVPEHSTLSAGRQVEKGRWELTAGDLRGLVLMPMEDAPPELELKVSAVSTERGNGAQAVATRTVKIRIFPGEPPAVSPNIAPRRPG